MSDRQTLSILHAIPGRARFAAELLRKSPPLAEQVSRAVLAVPGIDAARVNPWAGSLVISYDARIPLAELLVRLHRSPHLATWGFADLDPTPLSGPGARGPSGSAERTVETVLATASGVNAAASSLTGRITDLKIILPAALASAGILRLFTAPTVNTPHWVVLFMYGLDLFALLNRPSIRRFVDQRNGTDGEPS